MAKISITAKIAREMIWIFVAVALWLILAAPSAEDRRHNKFLYGETRAERGGDMVTRFKKWLIKSLAHYGLRLVRLSNRMDPAFAYHQLETDDGPFVAQFSTGAMGWGATPEEAVSAARKKLPWYCVRS